MVEIALYLFIIKNMMVITNYLIHLDLYALYSTLRRNQYYRGGSFLVGG
jgi:hypothetical protein